MIIRDEHRGTEHTIPDSGARLGRDPSLEITFTEEDNVVSAVHCRIWRSGDGNWYLEDLGSTNGTWVNGQRISAPAQLGTGTRFTLGQRGPSFKVRIPGQAMRTMAEPAAAEPEPGLAVRLRRVKGGADLVASGREVVLGRAAGCQLPLRTVADTVVSKRHAQIDFDAAGTAYLSDLGSRNGTFLNGKQLNGRNAIRLGDRIMLGWQGPLFEVRALGAAEMPESEGAPYRPSRQPPKTLTGMLAVAEEKARDSRGVRAAVYVRSLAGQMATESSWVFRVAVLAVVTMLGVGVLYVYQEGQTRTAEAERRLADTERMLARQRVEAESARAVQSQELDQMRRQLASARAQAVDRATLDSLERRVREAESRQAAPAPQVAVPAPPAAAAPGAGGADFTQVARENGRAVGLVIARFLNDSVMGSGFAITASGYFVTNKHVVDTGRGPPRTVMVVMAETNRALMADVVAVSSVESQDVAILRVRGFSGQPVRAVDWAGRGAVQGAPAAIIGFPFGTQMAVDAGGFVRTHLLGGYIAQTGDWIRFSGSTYQGVSGSPMFNAAGEVISVHFGAPREGTGLGISVPMRLVRRWLPADARAELGL